MAHEGYRIEAFFNGAWRPQLGLGDGMGGVGLQYGLGWMENQRERPGPRIGYRLVRAKDGKVMSEAPALAELSLGPLPQGYIVGAVARALDRAALDAENSPDHVSLPIALRGLAAQARKLVP